MDPRLKPKPLRRAAPSAELGAAALGALFTDEHTSLRAQARACLEAGELERAGEFLHTLQTTGDRHPSTLLLVALWLVAERRTTDALAVLDTVIEGALAAGHAELARSTRALRESLAASG